MDQLVPAKHEARINGFILAEEKMTSRENAELYGKAPERFKKIITPINVRDIAQCMSISYEAAEAIIDELAAVGIICRHDVELIAYSVVRLSLFAATAVVFNSNKFDKDVSRPDAHRAQAKLVSEYECESPEHSKASLYTAAQTVKLQRETAGLEVEIRRRGAERITSKARQTLEFLGEHKEATARKYGYVYVIEDKVRGMCKIGTSKNPNERIKAISVFSGIDGGKTYVSCEVSNGMLLEKICHRKFSNHRVGGSEWFKSSFIQVTRFIQRTAVQVTETERDIALMADKARSDETALGSHKFLNKSSRANRNGGYALFGVEGEA